MTAHEFTDYIFDRYAYLELAADADAEDIRREIKRRRAENHTDKLQRVSDEILRVAAQVRERLDDCARVLLDVNLRQVFDEKLAEFQATAPHLVSETGTPKIDPTRYRVDLDYLLQADVADLADLELRAAQMAGHDEKRLAKARQRMLKDPEDLSYRDDLRDALTHKLSYLTVLEDFYWQKAGVYGGTSRQDNLRAARPEHFTEQLEVHLSQEREEARTAVQQRQQYAALGFSPVLLLSYAGSDSAESTSVEEQLTQAVVAAFQVRAEDLRRLVEHKREVIHELAAVSRWRWAHDRPDADILDIVFVRSEADFDEEWPGTEFVQPGMVLRLDRRTQVATPLMQSLSAEEVAGWPHALAWLEPNREIPGLFIEAMALAERLGDRTPRA